MEPSEGQNRRIEHLRIKPISHTQIDTYQIAVPESQQGEILQERREVLRRSLVEQGSNLIPLIVRRTEAYSNEEEYEVVSGADWCIVAKELNIERLWAWIFEMTDEEVAAAKVEMERLSPVPSEEAIQIKNLLQQVEVSFQDKVEALTKKIELSIKKNEDFLKKQVKVLAERGAETDQIEQIKHLIANLEKTFHEKVDNLAKKITQAGNDTPTSDAPISGVNVAGALRQLDALEKSIERNIEVTVQSISEYVSNSIKRLEDELKSQVESLRRELQTTPKAAPKGAVKVQPESKPEPTPEPEQQPKSRSKAQPKAETPPEPKSKTKSEPKSKAKAATSSSSAEDYDSLSLRKLKLIGKQRKLRGYARMKRPEILAALKKADSGK